VGRDQPSQPWGPAASADVGAVREALARLQLSVDHAPDAVFWMNEDGTFAYANRRACASLGYSADELARLHLWDVDPDFPPDRWATQWRTMREQGQRTFETRYRRKDGTLFPVEVSACHLSFPGFEHHVAYVRDVSAHHAEAAQREKLAAQLHQAQKLESIGRLAGGVAHDFNNMLSVILGYAELLVSNAALDESTRADLGEIVRAAERSRELTSQLLAFSRKQATRPRLLHLDEEVRGLVKALERLIGEDIAVKVVPPDGPPWSVRIDPSQVQQVLMNLAANARDAMPRGGSLTIETANVTVDAPPTGAAPGPYVRLTVTDTGEGIDAETLEHVFEPFFTTKPPGQGTGLGLATVYGIVEQNGGFVDVSSEPGRGTRFRLWFPAVLAQADAPEAERRSAPRPGAGHVLLVEDDEAVRALVARMVTSLGYQLEAVGSPAEALERLNGLGARAVLLTDVLMPGMNGLQLRDAALARRPDLKVLFMSGLASHVSAPGRALPQGQHFLSKPFSLEELAGKLHELLNG
jgi:PAS domain S-box-containing protein